MSQPKLATEFESSEESPGLLLWRMSNKWQMQQRKALLEYDLTHVQFVLLATLVWSTGDQAISQKELAVLAQTDIMMTSQVVRTLEQKSLLTRTVSETDKRSFLLEPTQMGITLANQVVVVVEAVDRQFFGTLGKDASSFTAMMQKLLE